MTDQPKNLDLYGADLTAEAFGEFLGNALAHFSRDPIAVLELEDENRLELVGRGAGGPPAEETEGEGACTGPCEATKKWINDLLGTVHAGRIFCGERQVKFRRLGGKCFRVVSDFPVDGWLKQGDPLNIASSSSRAVFLWGYAGALGDGRLFEEQIPRTFHYPGSDALSHEGRMQVRVETFLDATGCAVWDRFAAIEPWEPPSASAEDEGSHR